MVTIPWRPSTHIRVKALGLHWRDGRLLAAEVRDDQGRLTGVRPLGGGIEFGENWYTALAREFKEELGVDVQIQGAPLVMESIYTHEGAVGHEVLFIGEVILDTAAFAHQSHIAFQENSGTPCIARWFDIADLDLPEGPALFPSGLKQRLQRQHPDRATRTPPHQTKPAATDPTAQSERLGQDRPVHAAPTPHGPEKDSATATHGVSHAAAICYGGTTASYPL